MALPPLYKFLDIKGAKLTLRNRTFKYAKPSDFNDRADLTTQTIFPEEIEVALETLETNFINVILNHLDDMPTCSSPDKEKIIALQNAFRTNPNAAETLRLAMKDEGPIYNVDSMREKAEAFLSWMNNFLQSYRVLCVTSLKYSEKMWTDYAEKHKGIALRIEPNLKKDSCLQLLHPVEYRETRPPLYENTLDFLAESLFGRREALRQAIVQRIIHTKTLEWKHECEFRLAIPLSENETPWDTLAYHPEEITQLYLGSEMEKTDSDAIVSLARIVNPDIEILQATRGVNKNLEFEHI